MMKRPLFSPLFALALLSACSESADPDASPSGTATPSGIAPPVEATSPTVSSTGQTAAGDIPVRFRAIGTEPFWSVQVQDGTLTYSTPDMPDGLTVPATIRRSGDAMIHSATIDGKPLELEVSRQTCSDGMSDTVYPLAVIRRIGPDVQRGCAR